MAKTISVALATYKGAAFVGELLQSLAQQHLPPHELVVSDDNSPDDTVAIVEAFAETSPFKVRVLRNTVQLGIEGNFARAFEHCTGDLIAYCDQDDIWAPEKLATLACHFTNPEVKLVMHRSEAVDSELRPLGYFIPEKGEVEFGAAPFPSSEEMTFGLGHQMLFDAQIYRDYAWIFRRGFAALQPIAENYCTQFRFLAGLNGTIVSLEDVFVKFRRHEDATSGAGLVDDTTAATSGFQNKDPLAYKVKSEEFKAIANVFEDSVLPEMPSHRIKIERYVAFMKKRGNRYRARGKIYEGSPVWTRAQAWLSLIAQGAYLQKRHGGFGRRAMLVDAMVATCGLRGAQRLVARRG